MVNTIVKTIIGVASVILISIASFYIYFATRDSINGLFVKIGIENTWTQVGIVFAAVIAILVIFTMILGKKINIFETIKDILQT
ncbi:hypothetical protein CMI37_09350 [Candidatus Pacearchaeota archaeon]|nr:hypothetical protein [Candidatus Pacearchaeota archaeon]|tara:strand:- start:2096 stop:2347 length:252 start_codon:yes stop_codon:yes gene_type:complete